MSWISDLLLGYINVLASALPLPRRKNINFVGPGLVATDNAAQERTDVSLVLDNDAIAAAFGWEDAASAPVPQRYLDVVIAAGEDATSGTTAHSHRVGARAIKAGVDVPWATNCSLVLNVIRNSGEGNVHVTLTDIESVSPVDLVDQVYSSVDAPVGSLVETVVDVTASVIDVGQQKLIVYSYVVGTANFSVTYAALRFEP